MKTGTLTWHFLNNYGSLLQAYALQKTINRLINGKNQILDYYQESQNNLHRSLIISLNKKGFFTTAIACLKVLPKVLYRHNSTPIDTRGFIAFRNHHLIISQETYSSGNDLMKSLLEYDAYIVGSDNIWIVDPDTGKPHGLSNENYYLNFAPSAKKRISYAASMGDPIINTSGVKNFTQLFETLDFLSVRERRTAEVLSSLLHREVAWVVDPTLLLTADDWDEISQESVLDRKYDSYIVVYVIYALSEDSPIFKYANYLAKLLRKDIVYIGYHIVERRSVNRYVSVPDFLFSIKNAAYVITNSFHGTVFSIIYRRAFAAFPPRDGECRITDLLESFNLSSRYATSYEQAKNLPITIDYAYSESLIEVRREHSMEWLSNALTSAVLEEEI